jgi:hypothetical protein
MNDPIVDEVRRVRKEHAARFNHDLWAIFRDIKEQQQRSGLNFVSFASETSAVVTIPQNGVKGEKRENEVTASARRKLGKEEAT